MPDKASPIARTVRSGLGLGASPKSQSGEAIESPQASNALLADDMEDSCGGSPTAKEEKASPAFTAQGTDAAQFDETTRVNLKRFFYKGKRRGEPTPEVGHYRVQENLVMKRVPLAMDFGARPRCESRRLPERMDTSRELGPEDLSKLDFRYATSGSMTPNPSMFSMSPHSASRSERSLTSSWPEGQFSLSKSLMSTSSKRPSVNNIKGARSCLGARRTLNEVSEANQIEEQDLKLSHVSRIPVWNFDKFQPRKGEGGSEMPYYEVGKYEVNPDSVLPSSKVLCAFDKQLSRATHVGHQKPKGMLDENGTACIQDRSLYRQGQMGRTRITHVLEMSKDLARPPLIKPTAVLHDESDPDVVAAIREREMTFDASTLDRAVKHRHDFAPVMSRSLPRDRAGTGARIAQDDVCIRMLRGSTSYSESHGEDKSPAELKDLMGRRADIGLMRFDQTKARDPTRINVEYSSLRKPRSDADFEFSRSAPASGFATRTGVKVFVRSPDERKYEAEKTWTTEASQIAEMQKVVDSIMAS